MDQPPDAPHPPRRVSTGSPGSRAGSVHGQVPSPQPAPGRRFSWGVILESAHPGRVDSAHPVCPHDGICYDFSLRISNRHYGPVGTSRAAPSTIVGEAATGEELSDPLYVSVHIPKTAGTTLRSALRSRFGNRLQEAYEDHPDLTRIEAPQCIHGHDVFTMFGAEIARHPNTKWITFLREPLAVAISLYFHCRRTLGPEDFKDRGLVHWLTHSEEYRWPDPPCYGHDQYQLQWVRDCERSFEQFDFVGITEQFDESILILCDRFNWDVLRYHPENAGGYGFPRLDDSVIDRFMKSQRNRLCDLSSGSRILGREQAGERTGLC